MSELTNKEKLIKQFKEESTFAPFEFVVTPELNQQYLYGEEDYHSRYLEASENGPPLVHSGLLLNMSNSTRSPSFKLPKGFASIHSGDEVEFKNAARVGMKLKVTWEAGDVFSKRGKDFSSIHALMVNEDGVEILRRTLIGLLVTRD